MPQSVTPPQRALQGGANGALGWRSGLARAIGPASIAACAGLLAWWSWGKWTDVQIDFGNELYIAWQLSEGAALYRDIAYRNGPLSPTLNALWFDAFGVSLKTLVYCNLAILGAICALTYAIFVRACDRITASVCCLVLLSVFAFSQYVGIANYNYVTPYQHAQTHGLALGIALIAAMGRFLQTGRVGWLLLGGLCFGLLFLTKLELFAAAAAAAALGWTFILTGRSPSRRPRLALAAAFGLAGLLPVGVAFAFLAAQMPAALAWDGVLGNWRYLGAGIAGDPFYRTVLGVDDVSENLRQALRTFVGVAGFGALCLAMGAVLGAERGSRRLWGVAAGAAVFLVFVGLGPRVPWMDVARALPLTSVLAVVVLAAACLRSGGVGRSPGRWAPLALWAVFSLVLLAKMLFRVRFAHYGFALAMPATLLLVAGLVCGVPSLIGSRWGAGAVSRGMALGAVAAGVLFMLTWSDALYARKDFVVGAGSDAILVEGPDHDRRGQVVAAALSELEARMPATATLLVLPEGAGLNYWLRRRNPTPYTLLIPTELKAFGGDDAVLRDLRLHPPDYIALVDRDHSETGVGPFGADPENGRRIMDWVTASYRRVARVGAEPFRKRGFGIVILERAAR